MNNPRLQTIANVCRPFAGECAFVAGSAISDCGSSADASSDIVRCILASTRLLLLVIAGSCGIVGCGYTVQSSFDRDIKTVHVPIFDNDSDRRGLEFQLTEAVQKEITKRAHYRLAKGLDADTRLTGKIVSFRKDVMGETRYDDPRQLQISMFVKVLWEDIRTGKILAQEEFPLSPDAIPMAAQAEFSPEVGQSLATAIDDASQLMARRIVNLMELPW